MAQAVVVVAEFNDVETGVTYRVVKQGLSIRLQYRRGKLGNFQPLGPNEPISQRDALGLIKLGIEYGRSTRFKDDEEAIGMVKRAAKLFGEKS